MEKIKATDIAGGRNNEECMIKNGMMYLLEQRIFSMPCTLNFRKKAGVMRM